MRVAFVRTRGQADRFYVTRSNGSETSWSFPTFGDGLPHDLVHLVVESRLGISKGFWGRVDAGVDPRVVNEQANRKGGKDKYAAFGEDLRELYLAEALAGLPWSMDEISDEERLATARQACERMGVALPANVTAEALATIRGELAMHASRWRSLGAKGTIELTFPLT